jgi:hypothetical protein
MGHNPPDLFCVYGIVEVALAAAVAAAKAWNGCETLTNCPGNSAFQIQPGSGDDCILKFAVGQEIIDVPSSGLL